MAGKPISKNPSQFAERERVSQRDRQAPAAGEAFYQDALPASPLQQSLLRLQQTAGNRALQRLMPAGSARAASSTFPTWQMSRAAASSPAQPSSAVGLEEEETPGPVSADGIQGNAPVTPAPATTPQAAATPGQVISSLTRQHAPSGAPDERTEVGVKEIVELMYPETSTWTASRGDITPPGASGNAVWTAPETGGSVTITATPASGTPATLPMTVVAPSNRSLVKQSDRTYDAGKAGSGFVSRVTIMPNNVSFTGIEVREETAVALATGYYDTVLGWNGKNHPQTARWLPLDNTNSGIIDTVGTNPPGSGGTFAPGVFIWPIPQNYRAVGVGGPITFSVGTHIQTMTGANGAETTDKEGSHGARTP
jgi:hypothetical protein